MCLFNLSWAAVGLYMYANEMSDECQDEDIGIMVFAWSLVCCCLAGLPCCCACCCWFAWGIALKNEAD